MPRREFNVWLAFADVVFILFLCALLAGAASMKSAEAAQTEANQALMLAQRRQRDVQKLSAEKAALNRRLEAIERNRFSCDRVDPLLDRLAACVYARLGEWDTVDRDICSVTVSEDLVRFAPGEARPMNGRRADALAGCFAESARWFEAHHSDALSAINTVHIDGFTDCVGDQVDNSRLGADRALELYTRLVRKARADGDLSRAWFSKVAVRSFGESRPSTESPCPAEVSFKNDRRVRFAVDMNLRPARGSR